MQPADPAVVVSDCHGIFLISIKDVAVEVGGVVFCCWGRLQFQWNEMFGQSKEREREFLELQSLSSNELASWRSVQFLWALLYPFTWLTYSSPPVQSAGPVLVPRSSVCSSPLFRRACYFTNRFWGLLLFHYPTLGSAPLLLKARNLIPHKVSHFSHDSLTFHSLLGQELWTR